ncbi:hypothetical protein [Paludisphaera rhizosphaerae]|uniref:hypothetical protein n=1 Tax=Paludisphaera rhizosphaerae TaxID=2711216 RepID=UPI0013EC1574|nr:hypothetical protein [Paludisphaera rhizosphaerae]
MNKPLVALFVQAALVAVAPTANAENVDHPTYLSWAKQPLGTRVVTRSRSESKGGVLTTTTTTTLKAVKPEKVVLETLKVSDATGSLVESPPERRDQYRLFPLIGKMRKEDVGKPTDALAQGEEKLTVSGREFKAIWFDTKGVGDGGLKWTARTWMSDDVPGRLLKSVTRYADAGVTVTVEAVEIGGPETPASPK